MQSLPACVFSNCAAIEHEGPWDVRTEGGSFDVSPTLQRQVDENSLSLFHILPVMVPTCTSILRLIGKVPPKCLLHAAYFDRQSYGHLRN